MQRVMTDSQIPSEDWEFYNVYLNKQNKESLEYLKWGMSLSEFSFYKEVLDIQDAMEEEMYKEAERQRKALSRRT